MDANHVALNLGEYDGFRATYRLLYSVLAVELWYEPQLAMHILALWIWLEQLGFKNLANDILSMPFGYINELANEAMTCLRCIDNPEVMVQGESTELPLTSTFLQRKICILILLRNRAVVLSGINEIADICAFSLREAMGNAIKSHRAHKMKTLSPVAVGESLINRFANLGLGFGGQNGRSSSSSNPIGLPMPAPMQPVINRSTNFGYHGNGGSSRNRGSSRNSASYIPPEERTMFITFSKGYPVTEMEVLEFFNAVYGNCVESFHMQKVRPGVQPLYARVVFHLPGMIDTVLNGDVTAKISIKGNHVWMRKFIPRVRT